MMTIRHFLTCQKGAAAAEMALIAPLAVLLLFTAMESGHYFYSQHQLVKAVRDGARFGARHSFDEVNCRNGSSFIDSDLETDIRSVALTGQISGANETRSGWDSSEVSFVVTVTCPSVTEATSGIYEIAEPAPVINVAATVGYNSLFNGLGIISDNYDLNASQQASVMGI